MNPHVTAVTRSHDSDLWLPSRLTRTVDKLGSTEPPKQGWDGHSTQEGLPGSNWTPEARKNSKAEYLLPMSG